MNKLPYIFMACVLLLCSCNKTKPQSPSNRRSATTNDSAATALVLTQQRLAEEADRVILQYVKKHGEGQYVMAADGYWYKKILKTQAEDIVKGSKLDLREIIYRFESNEMIIDNREEITMNSEQMLLPVWETLQTMHYGEQAELLIPWYAGYGATGTALVEPYTNLRIIIETY